VHKQGTYDARGLAALAKSISNLSELNISRSILNAHGAKVLAPAIKANRALAKLIFSGDERDSKPVTIEVGIIEADFSGAKLGVSGATILAAFMSSKYFQDNGNLAKLTFSGHWSFSTPVTIDTAMTEADFSGAKLGDSGMMILAAWLQYRYACPCLARFSSASHISHLSQATGIITRRWHLSVLRTITSDPKEPGLSLPCLRYTAKAV
jgi:hypothetical protein